MARRKTIKKQMPDDLSLVKRVARRIAPPTEIEHDPNYPTNWNSASPVWKRYRVLLYLHDSRWGTIGSISSFMYVRSHLVEQALLRLEKEGAVKKVKDRQEARRLGIEHFRNVRPCWRLTHKATQAIRAEARIAAKEK